MIHSMESGVSMKLDKNIIGQLALMVCGDDPYKDIFLYRTGSKLTRFFQSLDLYYTHDGSTRKYWVEEVLFKLNIDVNDGSDIFPTESIAKVIEQLLHPSEYSSEYCDREKAFEKMNHLLKTQNLVLEIDETTNFAVLKSNTGEFISTAISQREIKRVITFCPEVFNVPDNGLDPKLVAVMMPFSAEFAPVYDSIKKACKSVNLECLRVDEIWNESVIVQEIFNLIFSSSIVIADLSSKNTNVFYELGIAHTLGKHVVPIAQSIDDVPFDLRHHRVLQYLNNGEGRETMQNELEDRLNNLSGRMD